MDYAFYPLKEMLIEILGVAEEKKDFKTAFMIILCTQKISLNNPSNTDAETKYLSEFYYAQGVIRNRSYWNASISNYRNVAPSNSDSRCGLQHRGRHHLQANNRSEPVLDAVLCQEQGDLRRDRQDVH